MNVGGVTMMTPGPVSRTRLRVTPWGQRWRRLGRALAALILSVAAAADRWGVDEGTRVDDGEGHGLRGVVGVGSGRERGASTPAHWAMSMRAVRTVS